MLYRWPTPLLPGRLVRRYERFLADVQLDSGELIRSHCVNPGRMEGLVVPGARVWLSESDLGTRTLRTTWELIELDGRLIGTNTGLPNKLMGLALNGRGISRLEDLQSVQPEPPLGRGHRADFMLHRESGLHLVEVKNAHLVYPDGWAYFPDSKSERAVKHVEALARVAKRGLKASLYFTVQRNDARGVRPSGLHAPLFARALRRAVRDGLEVRAFQLTPSLVGFELGPELLVDTQSYDLTPIREWAKSLESTTGWLRKDGRISGQSLKS